MSDWYIQQYDIQENRMVQVVIPCSEAVVAYERGSVVQQKPFEGLPVVSRFYSERDG